MPITGPIEVHKALADETRHRLYRYIGLAGRPVSVREMSRRLGLHPNTVRPHLRRLEEAGLVAREVRKEPGSVGRPQTAYTVREVEGRQDGDYRLLAEMLAGLLRGKRQIEQARELARQWGLYLVSRDRPKPGARVPTGHSLALLQEAMARAGFQPRFRRQGGGTVEVTLRECPFRDLADEYRELVCALHLGLLEGMAGGLQPPLAVTEFRPFVERSICRATVG